MKFRLFVLGIALAFSAQAFAQGDAKAVEIVKKARAVVGKEDKIKALQNVVAEGTFKQSMGQRNMEGPIEITMAMPDKIYRSITRSFGPMEMTTIEVLNGSATWTDFTSSQPMPGGGGGNMMRGMMGFLDPAIVERNRRNDLARVMLGWFLLAPTGLNAEYTYVGEAKAPDGTADIIGVKTADGLVAKLYIDQQSHQLLQLSYKDKDPSAMFRGGGPGGGQGGARPGGGQPGQPGQGGQGGQPGQGGQRGPGGMSREEFEKLPQAEKDKLQAEQRARQEQMNAERKAAYEKAPEVDFQWSFSEYKEFNGLNLPTVLTKAVGGNPNEEWVISKFKFNEKKVTADKFEKKK